MGKKSDNVLPSFALDHMTNYPIANTVISPHLGQSGSWNFSCPSPTNFPHNFIIELGPRKLLPFRVSIRVKAVPTSISICDSSLLHHIGMILLDGAQPEMAGITAIRSISARTIVASVEIPTLFTAPQC